MSKMNIRNIAGIAVLFIVSMSTANAALVQYSDRTLFEAASGILSSEDFNSYTTDVSFSMSPLDVGDFTITYDGVLVSGWNMIDATPFAMSSLLDIDGTSYMLGGLAEAETIVLTFDSAITAFGADFTGLNDDVARSLFNIAGDTISLPVQSGLTTLFFGVVSDTPFDTVTLMGLSSSEGYGMDNVAYGSGTVSVPEPTTLALMGLGLAGIGFARKKKQA
jgi:hypothetical protein